MSRMVLSKADVIAQGGNYLAASARRALTAVGFVKRSGMCQKFARQNVQFVYGSQFDKFHKATAELSRAAWANSIYSVPLHHGSRVGDILYKRGTPSQPEGHVGIRVAGNLVAENSSVHGGDGDARGLRGLSAFGKPDLIVRLPNVPRRGITPGQ